MAWVPPGVEVKAPEHWPLARGEVKHVGDPVAVVVGEDRYAVVDAAEEVVVDYDPLPVVVDPEAALEEGSPLVHEEFGTNKSHEWSSAAATSRRAWPRPTSSSSGASSTTARPARRSSRARCSPSTAAGDLTLWTSTQIPHFVRSFLPARAGIAEDRIRVIAPDVGGGFGSKLQIYGEEAPWPARREARAAR